MKTKGFVGIFGHSHPVPMMALLAAFGAAVVALRSARLAALRLAQLVFHVELLLAYVPDKLIAALDALQNLGRKASIRHFVLDRLHGLDQPRKRIAVDPPPAMWRDPLPLESSALEHVLNVSL